MRLALPLLLTFAALPWGAVSAADGEKGAAALSLLKTLDEGFVQVYEKVAPTVVVIEAKRPIEDDEANNGKDFDFPFDDDKPPLGEARPDKQTPWKLPGRSVRSEGSGFIIRADGFILTNLHVVADAEKLEVRLKDGRILPAKIVGTDDKIDVAVIKIEAKGLPVAEFGDSDKVRVGQLVCAIGAPFQQDYSFSVGWVSGKGRTKLLGPSSKTILYEDYLQTDAFINPGNSGGPLFDVEGKIVGMNTLIRGLGSGLAFAIPSNMLNDASGQLITLGRVARPWLGVRIETLQENASLRAQFTGIEKGVVVDTIQADGPAVGSDLRPADIITEVDGVKVATTLELQKLVLKKKIGQPLALTVWRAGQIRRITVNTAELPFQPNTVMSVPLPRDKAESKTETMGLKLRDAKPAGAQVSGIVPESPASRVELLPEDVITEVDSKKVKDAAGCVSAIATGLVVNRDKGVVLNIERKGQKSFVVLRVGP